MLNCTGKAPPCVKLPEKIGTQVLIIFLKYSILETRAVNNQHSPHG